MTWFFSNASNDKDTLPARSYSVLVGNIGWVLQDSPSYDQAKREYNNYVTISRTDRSHRAYQEPVTLWELEDGSEEPIEEYTPETE